MKVKDFLKLYQEDTQILTLAENLTHTKNKRFHIKGLTGSLDAIVATTLFASRQQNHLLVLHDKEDAAYVYNDLQNLNSEEAVLFFPTSYKRPYLFDETENANILMRAEILNRINNKDFKGAIIVTYPQALTEKVINKRSLKENTFSAQVGEKVDIGFISELLSTYDFERTDFVYEAGQYAIRGGIIDIYSFSNELPYRLELFGNEIESIRTFDPTSQLSKEKINNINIIPNIHTRLIHEEQQPFLDFLPKDTIVWFKDYQQTLDVIEDYYKKATENFQKTLKSGGNVQIVMEPGVLFETSESFKKQLDNFKILEFGNRFYNKPDKIFEFKAEPQPSFNKNFELIATNLIENQEANIVNIIAAETEKQFDRLMTIFEELDPFVKFHELNVSLRSGFIDKNVKVACYTDHQLFERFHRYKTKEKHNKSKSLTLNELRALHPGDYVVHVDYGIGRFVGLEKVEVNGKEQEALRLIYRDDDLLIISIHSLHKISKYSGKESTPPAVSKLGSQDWDNKKKRVKKQVKDIAKDLINLYAKRKAVPGHAYSSDGFMQAELESSFIYEDTPDQATATSDVKFDMELAHPMDRLVCGDVGFGKTEVAIRAAFKAVNDGKQVAVLVPTTILAMQHYRTFSERLSNMPVTV
ncbi:MAG: DEAD/DEAH box helicase, partial [Bacteroidota bacterium]|nr:DEAD/DEAH box helicase [Bacteroidota bacterium]